MLMHEWLRYRERAATRRSLPDQPASEPEKPEAPEDSATAPATTAPEPAPDTAELDLGVCATSVRRYTNRGLLKCFRTPGNQRRFRLSDVLDFMEKQQSSASE